MTQTAFATDGYSVQPLFDPALVLAAQQDLSDHLDRVAHALHMPFAVSQPDEPLATRLDRIFRVNRSLATFLCMGLTTDAHSGPRLQALARRPELLRMAETLAGCPLDNQLVMRIRAGVRSIPDQLYPWRSDVAYDDGSECARFRITAWIPLTDTGPDSGGLELAPCRLDAPRPHVKNRVLTIPDADLAELPRVQPACRPGSVLFLDRFVPHRSLPVAGSARFALSVWIKAARDPAQNQVLDSRADHNSIQSTG